MQQLLKNRFSLLYTYLMVSLVAYIILRGWFTLVSAQAEANIGLFEFFSALVIGVLYDVAFVLYVGIGIALLLCILPRRIFENRWARYGALTLYFGLLLALTFTLVAEVIYWDEFTTRFNFIAVDYLIYRHEVTNNIYESYAVLPLLLGVFLTSTAIFLISNHRIASALRYPMQIRQRSAHTASWLSLAALCFLLVGQAPRNSIENNFAKEIASNGPYQFFAAFRNNELDFDTFYAHSQDKEMSEMVRNIVQRPNSEFIGDTMFDITRLIDNPGEQKRLNVILVSEESLGASRLKRYGEKLPLTPFIDQWMTESMVFDQAYATGTRTTRGLEAITLSIPPTPGRSVVKRPDNGDMYSLGRVFKEQDYDVAYLYGGRGFFDNMNTFFSGNGYRIVDQTMFEESEIEFSNAWGVDDSSLFQKVIQQADENHEKEQPFFFHVMTVSNHQPFTYPDGKISLPSGIGRNGGIMYADYSLRKFVEAAKSKPWFDDTIFVMIADHTANSSGRIGLPIEKYHIPFLIYSPKHIEPQVIKKVVSQIDLAPTLLGLLNFDYTSGFFGENFLAPGYKERALIGNYQKLGLYEDGEVIVLSPQKRVERISNPMNDATIEDIKVGESQLAKKTLAYYQSANYILKNKLNRVSSHKSDIAMEMRKGGPKI